MDVAGFVNQYRGHALFPPDSRRSAPRHVKSPTTFTDVTRQEISRGLLELVQASEYVVIAVRQPDAQLVKPLREKVDEVRIAHDTNHPRKRALTILECLIALRPILVAFALPIEITAIVKGNGLPEPGPSG